MEGGGLKVIYLVVAVVLLVGKQLHRKLHMAWYP